MLVSSAIAERRCVFWAKRKLFSGNRNDVNFARCDIGERINTEFSRNDRARRAVRAGQSDRRIAETRAVRRRHALAQRHSGGGRREINWNPESGVQCYYVAPVWTLNAAQCVLKFATG